MKRKEVYATAGTRMLVRVFAGWDFTSDEVHRPDFASQGYQRGVPKGGDLTSASEGAAPKFMVRALAILMVPTSTAFKLSRGGWTTMGSRKNAFTTLRFRTVAKSAKTDAARPRSAIPSMSRTRPTPTPSVMLGSPPIGKMRTSIQISGLSIMCAS